MSILGAAKIGTICADDDPNPSKAAETENFKFPAFLRFVLDCLDAACDKRPSGEGDAVVTVHSWWLVAFLEWLDTQGALSDAAKRVLLPLVPEHRKDPLPEIFKNNEKGKYCTPDLCGTRFLRITGQLRGDGTFAELALDADALGDLQENGSIKPYGGPPFWNRIAEDYDAWLDEQIRQGYIVVGV